MPIRTLVALGLLLSSLACTARPPRPTTPPTAPAAATAVVRVGIREGGQARVEAVPLEEYVQAAILSEFSPQAGDAEVGGQMLEIQAIVARTYALAHRARHGSQGFDLCATTHCQIYDPRRVRTSRWSVLAHEATSRTRGRVLWHTAGPATAVFHADCGGATAAAADVWGPPGLSYLVSRPDDGPATPTHRAWTFDAALSEVLVAINADARTAVGARLDGLSVLDRDPSGRVTRLAIHGSRERLVTGVQLREALTAHFGATSLKSTLFSVHREGTTLRFTGRGFGHGVGLCQAGALGRLRAGDTVLDVLHWYFPGTRLVRAQG